MRHSGIRMYQDCDCMNLEGFLQFFTSLNQYAKHLGLLQSWLHVKCISITSQRNCW